MSVLDATYVIPTTENIISMLAKNNSKKFNSFHKNQINDVITLLHELHKENNLLKQQNTELIENQKEVETLKLEVNKLQITQTKTKKIGTAFIDRLEIFKELWALFVSFSEKEHMIQLDGGLCGSYNRQLLELPFALENNFEEIGFGNPIGHDIDIILYQHLYEHEIKYITEKFIKLMTQIDEHVKYSFLNAERVSQIKINNKVLINVVDVTLSECNIKAGDPIGKKILKDIPHYVLKFKDIRDNSIIEADILLYKPKNDTCWASVDFDVNGLILNSRGIINSESRDFDFLNVLTSIKKREAECNINFGSIYDKTVIPGQLRETKKPYFMQFAFTLLNRFKILDVGYTNIVSKYKLIDYSINTEDPCPITCCAAPYYEINLVCNHKVSIMAYIGILEESVYDSSQAIRCPMCRSDLLVKLTEKIPEPKTPIKLIKSTEILKENTEDCFLEEKEETRKNNISSEATDYIVNILQKKPEAGQPIVNFTPPQIVPSLGRRGRGWETS